MLVAENKVERIKNELDLHHIKYNLVADIVDSPSAYNFNSDKASRFKRNTDITHIRTLDDCVSRFYSLDEVKFQKFLIFSKLKNNIKIFTVLK